jgi:hypothetical protein
MMAAAAAIAGHFVDIREWKVDDSETRELTRGIDAAVH